MSYSIPFLIIITQLLVLSAVSPWSNFLAAAGTIGQRKGHHPILGSRAHPHYFELNITREYMDADCSGYKGNKLLVNNQLPGPTISVETGECVRILVRNQVAEGNITIHFHGIVQAGSTMADGVPYLSQDPIIPGHAFTHNFCVVGQAGTYFYHGHVGLHDETVLGPFIIREESTPFHYDDEATLVLSEWYHQSPEEREAYVLGPAYAGLREPDAFLINGRTLFDTEYPHGGEGHCKGYSIITINPTRTTRLHVIGGTTFRTLGLAFAHHAYVTIVEVDGTLVNPYNVSFLEVSPGQRFSLLIPPTEKRGDYTINTIKRWAADVDIASNGLAILRYADTAEQDLEPLFYVPPDRFIFPAVDVPYWEWDHIQASIPKDQVRFQMLKNLPASRTIVLTGHEEPVPQGGARWFLNNVTYVDPATTVVTDILKGTRRRPTITPSNYDPYLNTYPIAYGEVIDLVLQTIHLTGTPCRSHPWHTHGHSHIELAYGAGAYDEIRDGNKRNVAHPFYRDLTLVYPVQDPELEEALGNKPGTLIGCGWSKIRIIADNPGIWALHCHNTAHMAMGMMIALEEAPERIHV
ncbi:Cupredoxin [Dichotomocladium elegans]|nr:Cupredoxin [Dichotomocladium elegans]